MVRILLISIVLLGGCATDREPMVLPTDLPDTWHTEQTDPTVPQHWLDTLAVPDLADLISQALATNYNLQQQALQVQIAQERVKILRADRLPALNLALSGQRFRPPGNMQLISEQVDVSANVAFELDLWGKLSDAQQEAQLNLAAEEMAFLDAQRRLVARVVGKIAATVSTAAGKPGPGS